MELHRNDRNSRKLSLVGVGYGLVAFVVGGVFALINGRPTLISLICWASGGFFFLLGVYLYFGTLRRFRIAFSESGLIVHTGECDFEGSWDQVDAIGIEPVVLPNMSLNWLVLWLSPAVPMNRKPRFPGPGRKGYRLVELEQIVETREELVAALHRYAGPKFRSLTHV